MTDVGAEAEPVPGAPAVAVRVVAARGERVQSLNNEISAAGQIVPKSSQQGFHSST
jgi:hypothetical protein